MDIEKTMTFAWPQLLWLLAAPAGLLAWEFLRARRTGNAAHPKILRAEAGLTSVSLLGDSPPRPVSSRRRVLLCAGVAFGIVALARPQWGRLEEPVFDQSREIIIALDLSRSMLSPDVKPSRLERSKLLIQSLLDGLSGERVGLVVFSGTAFLQAPMSSDYEILREFLPALGPDFLPEGGTNYRQLIDTALDAFGEGSAADRYLIILSDGEATDDDWKEKADALAKRGIRVIGLGVGTTAGAMIPDGSGGFMKDGNGAVVMSKLEGGTLRELANSTHGAYVDASEWVDLPRVLAATVEKGRKGRFVEHSTVRFAERFQWALAPALLCLIASFWLEFPVRPKARAVRLGGTPGASSRARPTLAAVSAAALLLLAPARPAAGQGAPDPAASLSKVVGRLSSQERCSALDWAEFGRDTATWGQHLRSSGEQVPEGPVRDALAAVDIGERSDPKASDWPGLRSELEDLLQKKDEQKKQDQKKQDQKDSQQQNQDQSQDQDQKQKQDQQQRQDQKQSSPDSARPQTSKGEPQVPREPKPSEQQKAFGDMGAPS
ncbi:MAG TPA: VWA domain-containing protein, partial [Opitutaceae bacterium]|nr:VWA domain-containing protein [Opitutaceae bacterium]